MTREIKFRAINTETGAWIYFDLLYLWHCTKRWLKIDWETVNQYTGLKDKNGNEIYEGDILRSEETDDLAKVVYFPAKFVIHCDNVNDQVWSQYNFDKTEIQDYEVIGNIYENPELLK